VNIQLSERIGEIVNKKVAVGGYLNATDFVTDIVLRANEFDNIKLNRLRKEVNKGLDEINIGEVVAFDLNDILKEEAVI